MKTSGHQFKATTSSGPQNDLSCNKSESIKITKQKRKITGKKSSGFGGQLLASPIQLLQPEIQDMQTSFLETAPGDLKSVQGQFQDPCGKVKVQLFPIDEVTRKGLEQENHNPYLELTLTTRKRMSSVVKHLNIKWGSSKLASGELMLFPYNVCLDNLVNSRRWTLEDSDVTAADVHASLGSPAIFRLRYGWFSNLWFSNLEHTECQASTTPVHSDNVKPNNNCPVQSNELGPCHMDDSANQGFQAPFLLGRTNQNEVDQNNGKSANTSWVDCLSNMSFGAILSEVSETPTVNLSRPLPAQNSSLQQIPITCDSFDAAIAAFMTRHQPANPSRTSHSSILEAEETCHPFPFAKVTSSSHNDPASSTDVPATLGCNSMLGSQVGQASLNNVCPVPATTLELHETVDAYSEPKSCLKPHSQDRLSEELNARSEFQTENSNNGSNQFGGMDPSLPDSLGALENVAPCYREMNDGETIVLGGLIASSMDAFQNFSIF